MNCKTFMEAPEMILTQNGESVYRKDSADPEPTNIQFSVESSDYEWLRNYRSAYNTETRNIVEEMFGAWWAFNQYCARKTAVNSGLHQKGNVQTLSIGMDSGLAESLGLLNSDPETRGMVLHQAILHFKRIIRRCCGD